MKKGQWGFPGKVGSEGQCLALQEEEAHLGMTHSSVGLRCRVHKGRRDED